MTNWRTRSNTNPADRTPTRRRVSLFSVGGPSRELTDHTTHVPWTGDGDGPLWISPSYYTTAHLLVHSARVAADKNVFGTMAETFCLNALDYSTSKMFIHLKTFRARRL